MSRTCVFLLTISCITTGPANDSCAQGVGLDKTERAIAKEPEYQSAPKYGLMVLDPGGLTKVWFVEDGKTLYVDRNANGDLTDDGPPIEPSDFRQLGTDRWDFDYDLEAITPQDGSRHTQFKLRRWNYDGKEDTYGLSISIQGPLTKGSLRVLETQVPMYAGWFGTFWSSSPETAPIIHFGGPLTPRMLREKAFVIGSGRRRVSLALVNAGFGEGASSRLSIDALPADVVPRLHIDWPTPAGGPAVRSSVDLNERCCYWEFYTTDFKMPQNISAGMARLSLEFPDFNLPFALTTNEIEVPVVERANVGKD